MLEWLYLGFAIVFEVVGTLSLKYSSTNNSYIATTITAVGYILSFSLMWLALKKLDISIAYAVWAGVGTALVAVIGWILFKEIMTLQKAIFITLIIVGVAGLKYSSN